MSWEWKRKKGRGKRRNLETTMEGWNILALLESGGFTERLTGPKGEKVGEAGKKTSKGCQSLQVTGCVER